MNFCLLCGIYTEPVYSQFPCHPNTYFLGCDLINKTVSFWDLILEFLQFISINRSKVISQIIKQQCYNSETKEIFSVECYFNKQWNVLFYLCCFKYKINYVIKYFNCNLLLYRLSQKNATGCLFLHCTHNFKQTC